ncbi:hypothetical protein CcaverHIS002_0704280 [Cutaneotrichosporon cavernicola]|uniref:Aminopeptidase P N-terminal domain-containing protein n=1 Tax=Cutaneotrichosporon cavernicola TaxID=279322 RepID=A0AA48LAE2_9TREE|nr:uncharacterized protein CcaverHIS019_0704360 [Cutaneotrichosporon cavernicola]BEI87082.1 hypothetical protein CcaverHIS002_0704280 [Cutaneotrichosporon cavernicola]BEI94855.1 hypothetical protein CcaverHIS019_0704360 [Cutaneotrichosporon cavernicola]BEJ02629.1 hypothetical protein CcaverHIS631_0704240 [Cutaneotrichosporon cavernicola]BEJ10385.1 hypothetical protein CcaverHIS641_0704200 [Cutaneotrichosporon cavernicola]
MHRACALRSLRAHAIVRTYATTSIPQPTFPGVTNPKPPATGQPLARSHGHLVRSAELTPGITAAEYEDRRRRLMDSLPPGSVVVCMGGTVRLVSQQIFYKFRQATDFWYLTGFDEPDATAVLVSKPSSPRGYEYTLFVPPRTAHALQWEGECAGVDGALKTFGADEAYANTDLASRLGSYLTSAAEVYASLPPSPSPSASSQPHPPPSRRRSSLLKLFHLDTPSTGSFNWKSFNNDPPHLVLSAALASDAAKPLARVVENLRIRKSPAELELMARAGAISAEAHRQVMRFARPGGTEANLQATFEYHCALGGSERPAYVPVVASGANSLVIHYTRNDCVLGQDDMVLIDAGGEYHMYASDITRTFPVAGRFSPAQRDLYEAVLNVQKTLVARCKPGDANLNELHRESCVGLNRELKQIGFNLSPGDVERTLYPHFLSHHVGSDLHDCPTAERGVTLREGHVITIEPGLYVPRDPRFPKAFHGLGVRIEDEVAVTKDGPWVLTPAPKEVAEVEAACQG